MAIPEWYHVRFDGTVVEAVPENISGEYPDVRFWATLTLIDVDPDATPEQNLDIETVVEVRADDADGDLLATSRGGTVTVE